MTPQSILLSGWYCDACWLQPRSRRRSRWTRRSRSIQRGPAVSGNLNSVGSDTMNNLMTYWSEDFAKTYPTVRIQVEGKGSSTAPPALIAGTSQFGPMSRAMTPAEVDAIEKKYGFPPTQIRTALDTIGVYVNKDNPARVDLDAGARRGLLEDAQGRLPDRYHHLGPARSQGGVGQQADLGVRP